MESSAQHHEAAARWLVRRDSGEWSEAIEAEFQSWLSAATGHRVAYIRLSTAWRETDRVQALGAGASSAVMPLRERVSASPRQLWRWGALAASVLIAIAVLWFGLDQPPSYRTSVGGLASIPMSDGSKATLNTNSEMSVSLTKNARRVDLNRGEAFFEVAQDPSRPFVVRAGDLRITAVGTAFSVLRSGKDVRVVVTEGRVRIDDSAFWGAQPPAELTAGQVAHVGAEGVRVENSRLTPDELLSWRSGMVVFRQTPLPAAIAEMNRYNEHQLIIGDRKVAAMNIGGTFRANNVDAFVRLLEKGFPVRSEVRRGQVVLFAREDWRN